MKEPDVTGEWGRVREAVRREGARVLVAPDKFKGTLEVGEVAETVAAAVRRANPSAQVRVAPLADGGEGTAAVMARLAGLRPRVFDGHDALMRPCRIGYYEGRLGEGLPHTGSCVSGTEQLRALGGERRQEGDGEELAMKEKVCVVDAAAFVGLTMMGEGREPWKLTSWPVGEFVGAMLERECGMVCVAVGGTATVDGGAGMLQAVGYRFYDRRGELMPVPLLPGMLGEIGHCEAPKPPQGPAGTVPSGTGCGNGPAGGRLIALTDVDVPLVPGKEGEMSSLSFARQKGVRKNDMGKLAAGLRHYASAVPQADASAPGQGAGGGIGFALGAVLGAEVRMGASTLADIAGLFDEPYDLVVTGEGSFDCQSLEGKLTGTLIARARRVSTPVLVVAGVSELAGKGRGETGRVENKENDDSTESLEDVAVLTTAPYLPVDAPLTHASALDSLKTALEKFFH